MSKLQSECKIGKKRGKYNCGDLCKICNIDVSNIAKHLIKHNYNVKMYFDEFYKKELDGICTCGEKTRFRSFREGYSKYCSLSCTSLSGHSNEETSKIRVEKIKKSQNKPENIERNRNNTKLLWENEEYKTKLMEKRRDSVILQKRKDKMEKYYEDPEYIRRMSERQKEVWEREEYRNSQSKTRDSEEFREKMIPIYRDNIFKLGTNGPNKQEVKLWELMKSINLDFEYVGNGERPVGNRFPDFICKKKGKIIEYFGTYWHKDDGEEKIQKRIDLFKKHGFDTLIIWDYEIKNENLYNLKNKMLEFVDGQLG